MSSYPDGSFREFTRWGSADFRRPPGNGKQGGSHLFAKENGGHGFMPSHSEQLQKDLHDNKTSGVNGLGTGQRCEREFCRFD
ncbi:hypothetical protein V6Z11_A05G326000 [Gossypium hirsutum]